MKVFLAAVLVSLALGSDVRESRQTRASCDSLSGITNPCVGTDTVGYYPHPSDNTKFLQCGGGRMFLVQCPSGEVYSADSRTCLPPANKPTTLPAVSGSGIQVTNPCSAQNIATGSVYFAVPGNVNKFIECSPDGSANLLDCPSHLQWDQSRQSCVYSQTQSQQPTQAPDALSGSGVSKNPCLGQTVTNAGLFFSHPDPSKFIQCDVAGNAFVLPCPPQLVWNEYSTTCVSPYLIYAPTTSPVV